MTDVIEQCPCGVSRSQFDDPYWVERTSPFWLSVAWARSHAKAVWAKQYRGTLTKLPESHETWLKRIDADWLWDDRIDPPRPST